MAEKAETPQREDAPADVPESILKAAKAAPDHWFGMVDPAWRGEDAPPHWAVVGQYRSDSEGNVVEWRYNADYRPSPSANGWPLPTDPVDEAIQRAATGYGTEDEVFRLLGDAEVGVLLAPDGTAVEACSPDGTHVVPVFTSEAQLRSGGRFASRTVPALDLVRELDGHTALYVNPAGAVSMTVDPEDLTARTIASDEREPEREAEREPERQAEPEAEPEAEPFAKEETDAAVESAPRAQGPSAQQHLIDVLNGEAL